MKRIITTIVLSITVNIVAQNASVEKSIFGIQTGYAGIWLNNEARVTNSIIIRSEIGIENDFAVGSHYDNTGFILQPILSIEPRYYYNLEKRKSRGNKTSKNSGNYLSLKTSYHPDWFVLNLDENITKIPDLSIIPTWGIRRQINNNFNFETGVGLGYRVVYLKTDSIFDGFENNRNQYIPYLHLRIGYVF